MSIKPGLGTSAQCLYNQRMKRWWILWALLVVTACGGLPRVVESPTPDQVPVAAPTTMTPAFTSTPTDVVSPTPPVLPTSTPRPTPTTPMPTSIFDPALVAEQIYLYPQPLVRGDRVTFDVVPALPAEVGNDVEVSIALPSGATLTEQVYPQGFDQQERARFYWAWDTAGLSGTQIVTLTLELPPDVSDPDPTNNTLGLPVEIRPRTALVPPEPGVRWAVTQTTGFRLHYLAGSAAARDLPEILKVAALAGTAVSSQLQVQELLPLDVYLLDRVLGQGGYATSGWVAISYVDRAYAPADLGILLEHELTHRLDGAIGCDEAPDLLVEGLAVMVAGGHYWPASLPRKAAILPGSDVYVPLARLAEDFYLHQHEVAYLEAGALVVYVREALGMEGVVSLCRAASTAEGSDGERLSTAFAEIGLGDLAAVERDWLRWLGALHPTDVEAQALEVEIRYLETMRAYQVRYDRVANFRHGVLFSPVAAAEQNITADFVRDPDAPDAIALELLLQLAKEALRRQNPARTGSLLDIVEDALDRPSPWEGMAQDVLEITAASLARGYEPYRILDKPAQGGWFVYAVDRQAWPAQRLLWAAQDDAGRWIVTGPQAGGER